MDGARVGLSGLSTDQLRALLENARKAGRHQTADFAERELKARAALARRVTAVRPTAPEPARPETRARWPAVVPAVVGVGVLSVVAGLFVARNHPSPSGVPSPRAAQEDTLPTPDLAGRAAMAIAPGESRQLSPPRRETRTKARPPPARPRPMPPAPGRASDSTPRIARLETPAPNVPEIEAEADEPAVAAADAAVLASSSSPDLGVPCDPDDVTGDRMGCNVAGSLARAFPPGALAPGLQARNPGRREREAAPDMEASRGEPSAAER